MAWFSSIRPETSLNLFARPELLRWWNMMQIRPNTVVPEGLTITCQLVNSFLFPLSTLSICVFPHFLHRFVYWGPDLYLKWMEDSGLSYALSWWRVTSSRSLLISPGKSTSFQIWYINKNGTCFKLQGDTICRKKTTNRMNRDVFFPEAGNVQHHVNSIKGEFV